MLLPVDRPQFRRLNAYRFEEDIPKGEPLRDVHFGLKMGRELPFLMFS